MTRVKTMIGVLSCQKYAARREACLATWANVAHRDDVDLVFLVGDKRLTVPKRDGPLLYCPCDDDRDSLSLKTRLFCLWATARVDFDFLFKCDDDTYVHVDRLMECETRGDFVGYPIPGRPGLTHPSGGGGYRLSRRAAEHVGACRPQRVSFEDWLVWRILTSVGIQLSPDSRYGYNCDTPPARENSQITCHWCSPEAMLQIHQSLFGTTTEKNEGDVARP